MFSGRVSQNRSGQRRRSRIAGPVSHRRPFRRRWRRRTIVSAGHFSGVGRVRRGPWFPRSRFSCLWCGDAFALDGLNEVHERRGAHDGDGFADHVVAEGISLARIQWDIFATLTFAGNVPKPNVAYGLAWRWLQELAKVYGVPYKRLLIALRGEEGERWATV